MDQMEDWVVYRVFQRKRRAEKQAGILSRPSNKENNGRLEVMMRSNFMINYMLEDNCDRLSPPQPASSSCSSEITEVSPPNELDREETSSRSRI